MQGAAADRVLLLAQRAATAHSAQSQALVEVVGAQLTKAEREAVIAEALEVLAEVAGFGLFTILPVVVAQETLHQQVRAKEILVDPEQLIMIAEAVAARLQLAVPQ